MGDVHRDFIEKFLDRIAQDPAFRRKLLENPEEALETSGFARELEKIEPDMWNASEVMGYGCTDTCFNRWTCLSASCFITA